ncbi:MAG: ribonuclease Z [Desulfobacterales bacterium]
MPPYFHPRLINDPFEDPGLFIPFLFEKRAILFDLGNLDSLSAKDILKVSHIFVTHTHMDHFIGFDQILRLLLGRNKKLCIYGPGGFFRNIEGKLAGYTWNLVENYTNRFTLEVSEVHADRVLNRRYLCRTGFQQDGPTQTTAFDGKLLSEPALSVSGVILDHKISCLGLSLHERFHININKSRAEAMGLPMGPWLNDFKQALYEKKCPNLRLEVPTAADEKKTVSFKLGELANEIAIISPGQKVTYITDAIFSEENLKKIIPFAKDSDHLFIEACFLDKHRDIARNKFHLTAKQAGVIARKANTKAFTVFHFSPRYAGNADELEQEASEAFKLPNS